MTFLYNAAAGPLRTAFSRTPIYNVTGVYPTTHTTLDGATSDIINNDSDVTYYVTYNVTDTPGTGRGHQSIGNEGDVVVPFRVLVGGHQ